MHYMRDCSPLKSNNTLTVQEVLKWCGVIIGVITFATLVIITLVNWSNRCQADRIRLRVDRALVFLNKIKALEPDPATDELTKELTKKAIVIILTNKDQPEFD